MIDHQKQIVHRTAYAGDECHLPETPIKERTEANHEQELLVYLRQKGYRKCASCFFGSTFEESYELENPHRYA
ncbi:hypothetical protein [Guptibacillus spartinae]|uniref:hypothetical protein n=1 Tax=Guptibacillus spartinae TaxID=3025679 RepID=UPI00235EF14B|nr:hypothetical protein [Pseudalkalibacillus spartinae]